MNILMRSRHRRIGLAISALALVLGLVFLLSMAHLPKPKTKGVYYDHAGIVPAGKECSVDSASGQVLRIDQDHENPLFQSKLPNRIHLLMWFKEGIQIGERITLPSPKVEVCYWEKGDLLMFHTTKPQGWIEITGGSIGGKLDGKMDMKLVEPDHNMSNSDYHYMGGPFSLTVAKL